MKINGLRSVCLLAVAALAAGCADGASEDVKSKTPCTANACKDTVTLRLCENGSFTNDVDCPLGCVNDACVQNACTMNTCADSLTLAQCVNGTVYNVACANGCENGMCKTAPGNTCIQSVCQDVNTLLNCVNGVQTPTACPYGCENGNCKSACTADVCKDGGTLSMCDNGVATDVACPLGCSAGKCNTACISDFCRDSSILMVCDEGTIRPTNCVYGCANDKCNSIGGACTESAVSCDGAYVQTCIGGQWVKAATACENGCEDGVCKGSNPPSGPKCTGGYEECDSTCKVTDGRTCAQACKDEYQSDVCCTDDTNKIYCEDPGVIPDSMTCSEYEATGKSCKLTDGTSCADYCSSLGYNTCCVDAKAGKIDCSCAGPTETCDETTYKESCDGNTGHYCDGGEIVDFSCDASAPCAVNATSGIADCVQSCKAGDADSVYCYDYYGMAYVAYPMHCEKTTTGKYGYFLDGSSYEVCEAGCTPGVGCDSVTPSCTNNDLQCSGNVLEICKNGTWTTQETCKNGCANNACKPDTTTCTNNDLQCNGNVLEICKNGNWTTQETCKNGCANNACKPDTTTCTTGDFQCNGKDLELCVSGTWQFQETCKNGCENNACKPDTTTCTNNDLQCNGDDLEICKNGSWTTKETCKNGCADGACKSNVTVPDPTGGEKGDACDDSYVEGCNGQKAQYCNTSGKVDELNCASYSGYSCHVVNKDGEAYSGCMADEDKCTKEGDTTTTCFAYSIYGNVQFERTCYPATDGGFYFVTTAPLQQCEGSCNAEGTACGEVESCNASTYKESCDGNTGYYCANGTVDTITCNSSAPCKMNASTQMVDCAASCTAGSSTSYYCYYNASYDVYEAYPQNCQKATDGTYGLFIDYDNYDICNSTCSTSAGCN